MDEITLAQFILKLVRDRKENIVDVLVNNEVKDMEHYRQLMGGPGTGERIRLGHGVRRLQEAASKAQVVIGRL